MTPVAKAPSGDALRSAMTINIATGAGAVIWYSVCVPNQLLNVFFRNSLGASSFELGLLVAVMQVATVFQLLSVFVYGKLKSRKLFWAACSVLHRMYGFILAGVALYVAQGGNRGLGIKLIIGGLAASWILTMVSATGWWTWQVDLYPERIRATFFGRRSSILAAVGMVWFFGVTVALDTIKVIDSLYVYAAIFAVGSLAGVADIVFHTLIPEPRKTCSGEPPTNWRSFIDPLRDANFVRYAAGMGLWTFAASMAGPFFAPYITGPRAIGAPYIWLGVMTAVSQIGWIVTVPIWGRFMDRYGRKPVVMLSSFSPLLWLGYLFLTHDNFMVVLPVLAVIGGVLSPGFAEGSMQLMLTLTQGKNRTACVAWYTTLIGLIGAGGALAGGRLNDALASFRFRAGALLTLNGFHVVILAGVALCMVSLLLISRVREDGSITVRALIGRIAAPLRGADWR